MSKIRVRQVSHDHDLGTLYLDDKGRVWYGRSRRTVGLPGGARDRCSLEAARFARRTDYANQLIRTALASNRNSLPSAQ